MTACKDRHAAVALVASLLAALVGGGCSPATTPNDSQSAAPTAQRTPGGVPSGSPLAPSETLKPAGTWTLVESIGLQGTLTYATDVVAWDGGFAAIGFHHPGPVPSEGRVPRLWTSPDGRTWRDQSPDLGRDDIAFFGLASLGDELLLVAAFGEPQPAPAGAAPSTLSWVSQDGAAWERIDLGLPDGPDLRAMASGRIGLVVATNQELWTSADGRVWDKAVELPDGSQFQSVSAGDDGFVAFGQVTTTGAEAPLVIASGDGRTWHPARTEVGTFVLDVDSLTGDWLATAYDDAPATISVWWSANGLDWDRTLDVNELTGPDGPKAGQGLASGITQASLAAAGGRWIMTLAWNHCCEQMPASVGVWSTTDGSAWDLVPVGEAMIASGATDGSTSVLAGDTQRGHMATFWIEDD